MSLILIGIVFLTQSIRFLELVVEVGASGSAFWVLTMLALPRFFEVIIPIAVMISILFIYHRLVIDSELVVMRSAGLSSMQLARPAFLFISIIMVILYIMAFWVGPKSAASMQHYRQVIKASASQLFFREGVFNTIGDGLMFYIRQKGQDGEMYGLMIYDNRQALSAPRGNSSKTGDKADDDALPITIMAERGVLVSEPNGDKQIIVYNGQRQEYNPQTKTLNKLGFERYTVDIPEQKKEVRQRWAEPDERTITELIFPGNFIDTPDRRLHRGFIAEAHRRITAPALTFCFGAISLAFLLLGHMNRHGYGRRIVASAICGIAIQSLFLVSFNLAKDYVWANILMYLCVIIPLSIAYVYLKNYNRLMLRFNHR